MIRWFHLGAAAVLPLVILSATLASVAGYNPRWSGEERARSRHHGPEALQAVLVDHHPSAIALGNSVTAADVREPLLASLLKEGSRVAVLQSPGSLPSTWYLILKNEVYGEGHRPEQVLVVNLLANLLQTRPASEIELSRLSAFTDGEEPELERVLGISDPLSRLEWQLRVRRARLHQELLDGIRTTAASLITSLDERRPTGQVVESAYEDVFDVPADPRLAVRMTATTPELPEVQPPELGFLPLLHDLTRTHGGELVLVLAPTLDPAFDLTEEQYAAFDTWSATHGVTVIDLATGFGAADFVDPWHLNEEASRRFTRRLASALTGSEGPAPTTPSLIGRSGQPPPLQLGPWTPEGTCVWKASATGLPRRLRNAGPIFELLQDGTPLRATRELPDGCSGSWWQEAGAVIVSPTDGDVSAHTWSIGLPSPGADGARTWGRNLRLPLAPGQTLTWTLPNDSEVPLDMVFALRGHRHGEGEPSAAHITLGRSRFRPAWSTNGEAFRSVHRRPIPAGGTELTLTLDAGAPWIFVDEASLVPPGEGPEDEER